MSDLAKNEITKLLSAQVTEGPRKGFIPHQIYWEKVRPWNRRGFLDVERLFYKGWMPHISPLVAQPVLAQAVRSINDKNFFCEYADQIINFYKYFQNLRDPDGDGLISIITPRESGRDSSPEFDFFRLGGFRAPKPFKFLDTIIDTFSLFWLEMRYKLMRWDEQKILKSRLFDVQDLVEQCIYIDGLYDLVWMMEKWQGGYERWPEIKSVIKNAEDAVLDKCWNEEDRMFYSLRNGKTQIRDLTIANLFPLLVKDLPAAKEESIIQALTDETKFASPYPVPTVSISHPEFNASRTWPLWRGPTWINANWFLIRGLVRNNHQDIAKNIAKKSIDMIEKNGFREFFQPFTGKGLRVRNFGWSTLAVTFSNLIK